MTNQIVVVGKIVYKDPIDKTITLSLENDALVYTEILMVCEETMYQNINEHVQIHDLIGVRGHFGTHELLGKGTPYVDKVAFLSRKGGEE